MINTKPLSNQLSDLNVALGLFRKQIENVVAVSSDKNQIVSQVSNAIREYVSMYTGLQMIHSSADAVSDMTESTRQVISSTPFHELRDTLVRMHNRIEISSIEIPLITTNEEQGFSIMDSNVLNAQLSIRGSKITIRIASNTTNYEDSLGAITVHHGGSTDPDDYLSDVRLMKYRGNTVGIPLKVFTVLIPAKYREPFRLYHTQGAPIDTYFPWCFNLAFHRISDTKITFGAEVIFRQQYGNSSYFSVSKWGNQSNLNDYPSNYILIEDNVYVDSTYDKTANLQKLGYFSTPIPSDKDEDSSSVLFTDAPLVAVTKASLERLIKSVDDLIR